MPICSLLHPSLKHYQISANLKPKALNLVKQELLKRSSSSPTIGSNIVSTTLMPTASITFHAIAVSTAISLLIRCFDQLPPINISTLISSNKLNDHIALNK